MGVSLTLSGIFLIVILSAETALSQSSCFSGLRSFENYPLPSPADARHLRSSTTTNEGKRVIVPQMRASCSGFITSWSAHTLILTETNFIDFLQHTISFQVWRPDRYSQMYSLIGSNTLNFHGNDFTNRSLTNIPDSNSTAFFSFFNVTVPQRERIYFNPGDIIGWFIPAKFRTITPPLSPIFRAPVPTDFVSSVVEFHIANTSILDECILCNVAEDFEVMDTVVPLVSFQYEQLSQTGVCSEIDRVCNASTTPPPDTPIASRESTRATVATDGNIACPTILSFNQYGIILIVLAALLLLLNLVILLLNIAILKRVPKQGVSKQRVSKVKVSPALSDMMNSLPPNVENETPANYPKADCISMDEYPYSRNGSKQDLLKD